MDNKKKEIKWYDSGHTITNMIIATILLIIICSQSYAVSGEFSLAFFGSVINHNSIYLLILVYFVLLKFNIGKKYFNYLNVLLVFIYLISTLATFLTVIQSFSLDTLLSFLINITFLVYIVHTMFRDTRIWKDYKLDNSPFNEITNEVYLYIIVTITVFLLAVTLINTIAISGVVIAILDAAYFLLLGRYIFLYRDYLDKRNINKNNPGNFDEIKEKVKDSLEEANEKIQEVLDKTEIDDIIVSKTKEVGEKISEVAETVEEKVVEKEKKPVKKKATKKATKKGEDK